MADTIKKDAVVNEDELFTFVSNDSIESEKIIAPRYSYWRSVFRVFFAPHRIKQDRQLHESVRMDEVHE